MEELRRSTNAAPEVPFLRRAAVRQVRVRVGIRMWVVSVRVRVRVVTVNASGRSPIIAT